MTTFGTAPLPIMTFDPDWAEFMHYMYLPVVMVGQSGIRLPPNLSFMMELVEALCAREGVDTANPDRYVYLTMRRGWATPGNPLNRPGWHTDGFGSSDVNYIWTDRWPTVFAVQDFGDVSPDHVLSMKQFEDRADPACFKTYPLKTVLRLDASMVHCTPEILAPGGERGFFKVSFSEGKYALRGNAHNYLFDYAWEEAPRKEVRNDPAGK